MARERKEAWLADPLQISVPDGRFTAYVAEPHSRPAPAVVVIQEIFGVNKVMRDIADQFAGAGYLAVCPDLFWRIEPGIDITDQTEAEWARAFPLYRAFELDAGVRDLAATIAKVRRSPACSGKVGVVGFCLGGLLAYLCATRTDADAAVGYYGVGIENHLGEADRITRPLLLHIAREDQFVPRDAQDSVIAALSPRPGVTCQLYPGRDHAFARAGGAHYDAADAALANERTLALFAAVLGG